MLAIGAACALVAVFIPIEHRRKMVESTGRKRARRAPEQDSSSPGAIAAAGAFVLIHEEGMSIVDRRRADDPGAKSSGAGA
ncbi:hypothetical protein I6F33_34070 [Bradyrhizobium sp. BRP20]|uniref:hypothetical protein n=1 Tax=unclassified Bradyrhizobium TaxID=2631580 RepID=UPI001CD2AA53|nr:MULTISPECIES: hypothetical protein [unclassified Bradyrhizobium]MCA1437954.1 hypothetical protein [Bradyrhizobium sp. BRP20]MCA1552457.1 hypothetical protein [Bradyrhizobium sp. BRP19]